MSDSPRILNYDTPELRKSRAVLWMVGTITLLLIALAFLNVQRMRAAQAQSTALRAAAQALASKLVITATQPSTQPATQP